MEPVMVLVVVVGLVILFSIGLRNSRKGGGQPSALPHDVRQIPLSPKLCDRVEHLLRDQKQITAIKELRVAMPDLSLRVAKELTDAMLAGHQPPTPSGPTPAGPPVAPAPATPAPARDLAERVRELRTNKRETEAIRLVCDETGMGILDAQKFVRALD